MKSWQPTPPPFAYFKREVFQRVGEVGEFIYQIGELPALREHSSKVPMKKVTSEKYKAKFEYLKNCLRRYRELTGAGRGITAVQVGIPEQFSVIYHPKGSFIIINPIIIIKSENKLLYPEICMSANPLITPIIRSAWIEFTYYDEQGKAQKWDKKDTNEEDRMMNRVFQHEISHMEGIINIDLCHPRDLIFESDPTYYATAKFTEAK